ncbi:hypothetical protein P8452_24360 [Trifolium repens]|nr:hypothetical protein P8452_24360 [Trifolium repens]
MATKLTLLFLFSTLLTIVTSTPASFIKSSCSTTSYPALCVESLSSYASTIQQDPHQLVQTALSLSLNKTQSTKTFVVKCKSFKNLKPREYAALHDCVEEITDSVDRLSRSLKELKLCKISGQDFNWHISNVQTWLLVMLFHLSINMLLITKLHFTRDNHLCDLHEEKISYSASLPLLLHLHHLQSSSPPRPSRKNS